MSKSTGKKRFHFKDVQPKDPAIKSFKAWLPANQGFYSDFRGWLRAGGYGDTALNVYGVATRLAIGLLDKPYWRLEPEADIQRVRDYLAEHFESEGTRAAYEKGLTKLAEYIRLRCNRPAPERQVNWAHYLGDLPDWLGEDVREFVLHCRHNWPTDRRVQAATDLLRLLTAPLRWIAGRVTLTSLTDLTPEWWFAYLDMRLANDIQPVTVNHELSDLQNLVRYLAEQGRAICQRLLLVEPLKEAPRIPRDVPPENLRRVLQAVETEAGSEHAGNRRLGIMDRAWFMLMLHSGLRTGEVRRLKLADIDWERRLVRIEQSKGLKDRLVPLSPAAIAALKEYLAMRGLAEALPDHVFVYRHLSLARYYCRTRLVTYAKRCGVQITPHQLRHSCATLLLNAGAPILAVQAILGHTHIDTTLDYARLYDGTIAADYYQAMAQVENHFALPEDAKAEPLSSGELLALVDSLRGGTLNESQTATVRSLRAGILALAKQEHAEST